MSIRTWGLEGPSEVTWLQLLHTLAISTSHP